MKLQPRHLIAASFLALSVFLLYSSVFTLARSWRLGWEHLAFTLIMTVIMVVVPGTLGVLALKRRWEDFVKIIGFFVAIAVFTQLSRNTSTLAKAAHDWVGADYPLLGAFSGMCVAAAPFVISIVGYQRLVPLIVRRIYRSPRTES